MNNGAAPNVLIGAILILLLCCVAGRPQIFSDTKSYYALGHEAALTVHHPVDARPAAEILRGRPLAPRATVTETKLAYTVAASRSPYWSALFYLAVAVGSAWLVVALQAIVAAAVVWIAVGAFGVGPAYLPIIAALAFVSSLPVQVMFLMPDLFAGLMILSAVTLAFARDRLSRPAAIMLWGVMVAGALFHTSHILILLALGGVMLLASAPRRNRALALPALQTLAAALVGVAGAVAFPLAVQALRHQPVFAPPFLSARLIADGPGRALLRRDCATHDAWGWCAYLSRPMTDVNTILWSDDPAAASFQAADYDRRVRIIREQPRFVLATIGAYPAAVARTTLDNIGRLLLQYRITEALADPTPRYRDPSFAALSRIVPDTLPCAEGRKSCAPRIDLHLLDRAIGLALLLSCAVVAATIGTAAGRARWGAVTLAIGAAMVLNAVICGGISGNAERYQSRITWLVPLLALMMAADWLLRRASIGRASAPDLAPVGA